jgi:hypothetical protein
MAALVYTEGVDVMGCRTHHQAGLRHGLLLEVRAFCWCRVILLGVTVAFYILLAIGVKKGLQFQTGVGLTPWPSWAWFMATINSWLWLGLSSTSICGELTLIR